MTTDMQPVLDILARLIAFPTVSDQSNRALIAYVSEYLSAHDVPHHIFPDETGEKDGLIAQIGPDVAGGVVLSGHTDVVPVEGQDWTSDPWVLTKRDEKYFGRGSCDMKGFLALALAAVPDMIHATLTRPIQLAFSFDEETGCTGTAPLLRELERRFPRAASVIVGEPTEMRVVTGHKGGIGITTQIHGKAAHSSLPDLGVSAISYAARLIQWHDARMQSVQANADSTSPFSPPHATLQVGTISGGSAVNIVPDRCTLESDIRYMPGERGEDWIAAYQAEVSRVERQMQAHHPEAKIYLTDIDLIPPVAPETNGSAEALARQLTGDNSDNVVSYQTEAGHFQLAGYSTVICGPGSIAQAHQPDEFISKNQLEQGQQFIGRLIQHLSAPDQPS